MTGGAVTGDETPLFEQVQAEMNERARAEFFADPEVAARQAKIDGLMARLEDPDDGYDAHHGTDRSPESLERARVEDPETYVRVLGKMAEADG